MWLVYYVFVCTEKIRRVWPVVEKRSRRSQEATEQDKRSGPGGRKNRPATIAVVVTASVRCPPIQAWSAGLRGCPAATSSHFFKPPRRPLPGPNAPIYLASQLRSVNHDQNSDPLHGHCDILFFNYPLSVRFSDN